MLLAWRATWRWSMAFLVCVMVPVDQSHEAWFWSVGIMASLDTCFPNFGGVAMSDTVTSSNESMLRNFLAISQFLYCRVIM